MMNNLIEHRHVIARRTSTVPQMLVVAESERAGVFYIDFCYFCDMLEMDPTIAMTAKNARRIAKMVQDQFVCFEMTNMRKNFNPRTGKEITSLVFEHVYQGNCFEYIVRWGKEALTQPLPRCEAMKNNRAVRRRERGQAQQIEKSSNVVTLKPRGV